MVAVGVGVGVVVVVGGAVTIVVTVVVTVVVGGAVGALVVVGGAVGVGVGGAVGGAGGVTIKKMAKVKAFPITWDVSIARAAAQDEGDRSARKAGRKHWNEEDYAVAVEAFNKLWPSDDQLPSSYK